MKINKKNIEDYTSRIIGNDNLVVVGDCQKGEANCVYPVEVNNKKYIFRANAFRDLREHHRYEFDLLTSIKDSHLSPEAYVYDAETFEEPISILEYIEGSPLEGKLTERIDEVMGLVNTLHSLDKSSFSNFHFFGPSQNSYEFTRNILNYESEGIKRLAGFLGDDLSLKKLFERHKRDIKYLESKKSNLEKSLLVPTHLSIHGGNLIDSQNGLKLIDWQRGGMGDGALGIYILAKKAKIDSQALKEYYNLWDDSFEERIKVYDRIFKLFNVIWLGNRFKMCQNGEASSEFDKGKLADYQNNFNLEVTEL